MKLSWLVVFIGLIALVGCESEYLPKPKGYNRIDLPTVSYQLLPDSLPYRFEYSSHAELRYDSSWMSEPNWIELYYPGFVAEVHITYKALQSRKMLIELLKDANKLTNKHQIKAYSIDTQVIKTKTGKRAELSWLKGEVPTPLQFCITDSLHHFLRGAIYFHTATQNDSLAPIIDFLESDVRHMLHTLEWDQEK